MSRCNSYFFCTFANYCASMTTLENITRTHRPDLDRLNERIHNQLHTSNSMMSRIVLSLLRTKGRKWVATFSLPGLPFRLDTRAGSSRFHLAFFRGNPHIIPCDIVNALENRYLLIFKQGGTGMPAPPGSKEVSPLLNYVNDKTYMNPCPGRGNSRFDPIRNPCIAKAIAHKTIRR